MRGGARKARKIVFMGWRMELPTRDEPMLHLDEHDLLRVVLLAEDTGDERWVEFKCEDRMHAIKVAHEIRGYGFDIEVVARKDRVLARRKPE